MSTLNSQDSSTTLCNRTNKGGSYFLRQKRNESMDTHRHEGNRGFCDITVDILCTSYESIKKMDFEN